MCLNRFLERNSFKEVESHNVNSNENRGILMKIGDSNKIRGILMKIRGTKTFNANLKNSS